MPNLQPITANLGPTINRGLLAAIVAGGIDLGGPGARRWTTQPYTDPEDVANRWAVAGATPVLWDPVGEVTTVQPATVCGPTDRGADHSQPLLGILPDVKVMEVEGPPAKCSLFGATGAGFPAPAMEGDGTEGATPADDALRSEALTRLQDLLWAAIEHEVWTGAVARVDAGNPNRYLTHAASADYVLAAAVVVDVATALKILEGLIGRHRPNRRALIHCELGVLEWLQGPGLALTSPNTDRVLTVNGSYVVAGPGYTGDGPGALGGAAPAVSAGQATSWMYATERMQIRLGEPYALPEGPGVISDGHGVNFTTNDAVQAWRQPFAYTWPGITYAIQVVHKW